MHDAAHADEINQLDKSWKESGMGVAAFVQDRNNGEVLQALSAPLYRLPFGSGKEKPSVPRHGGLLR